MNGNFLARFFETRFGSVLFMFGLFFLDLKFLIFESRLFSLLFFKNKFMLNLALGVNMFVNNFNQKLLNFFNKRHCLRNNHISEKEFLYSFFNNFYYFFCSNLFYLAELNSVTVKPSLYLSQQYVHVSCYPVDFFSRYICFGFIFSIILKRQSYSVLINKQIFMQYKQKHYTSFM